MDLRWKIYWIFWIMVIIAIIIIGALQIYGVVSTTNFCKSNGYDYYHTYTEEGYIACCSSILEDHIKTDETICKAFKR